MLYFYIYKNMVDEITPKSGENGVFLRKNNENEVILEVFSYFGCKKCPILLIVGSIPL